MCWNAPVSFVTLGAGTLLNILSYVALVRRGSMVAPLVWAWQYALLMQLPEGIAWLRMDQGPIEVESRIALFLNVTQPLSLLVAIATLKVRFRYAHVALFMYFLLLLTEISEVWDRSATIAPSDGCEHINLAYWNTSRGFLYVFASLFVISELPSVYWAVVNSLIFLTSLAFAAAFYQCGMGSMWCWLIWTAGPLLVVAELVKAPLEEAAASAWAHHTKAPVPNVVIRRRVPGMARRASV